MVDGQACAGAACANIRIYARPRPVSHKMSVSAPDSIMLFALLGRDVHKILGRNCGQLCRVELVLLSLLDPRAVVTMVVAKQVRVKVTTGDKRFAA